MTEPHDTGKRSEQLARSALESAGWTILHQNFRDGPREIDLVARRGDTVAFIEVKGRRSARHHHPLDAIGPFKRRDLARAAKAWIRRHGQPRDTYRFDAIAVLAPSTRTPLIEHMEDAWRI